MLLVAVPVCGMTVVTVLVRTNTDSARKRFARRFGTADLVARSIDQAAAGTPSADPAVTFPAGTRIVRAHDGGRAFRLPMGLATADGTARLAEVTDLDLTDPIAKGIVLLRSGRFPRHAVRRSCRPSSRRVRCEGRRHVAPPTRAWTEKVVGIGVPATNWNQGFLAVRGNELAPSGMRNPA